MKNLKLIIFLYLLVLSSICFGFINVQYLDDYDFPTITVGFTTDFEINQNSLQFFEKNGTFPVMIENDNWEFENKTVTKRNSLDIVFFIDTSFMIKNYEEKIINELKAFKNTVIDNSYDCSLRIITSSSFTNKHILDIHRNLLLLDDYELEDILDKLFLYEGISSGQFNLYMDYVDQFKKKADSELFFVFVTNGREIGQTELENYNNYMLSLLESRPKVFVFTETDFYMSENFYGSLAKDTNGYLFNIGTGSINQLLKQYFEEDLYVNQITYESTKEKLDDVYEISLNFNDRKERYNFTIKVPFYDYLRVNAIIADPFVVEKGEQVLLECITTPEEYVVYKWHAVEGELIGQFVDNTLQSNQIYWIAPEKRGNYKIYVECKYRGKTTLASVTVMVQ